MKTCANHVDEMEHYPVQGAMGLKEMNTQELAEFKSFRSELGELPAPTVEELATIPASYDLRTKWPQCKWLNNPGNQGGCGSCWVPPDRCPSTAHPINALLRFVSCGSCRRLRPLLLRRHDCAWRRTAHTTPRSRLRT